MAEPVNWALRWPGRPDRAPRPRPGPAGSPGLRAAPRCSAAAPAASPRPARGVPRRRPGHRSGPGQGRGRSARSRHWGLPPRSAGNCPPPARTCRCRTALCRGPPARCARPAPLPRHARAAGRRQRDSPGRAGRGPDGTTCNCRLPGPAAPNWHADLRRVGNRGRRAVLLTYVQILPSGAQPASCLSLAPFRGLRYAQDRVSGIAEVTSPPYDVIAHDTADHLLASDPHNVVRLILPRHDPGNPGPAHTGAAMAGAAPANGGADTARSGAAYDDAARLLRDWQAEGILVPDPEPALYVYEQSLPSGPVLQRGLIGALQLAPLGGPILPHEDVIPGPVTGRRQLMEATGANLEPIFLLYDGPGEPAAPSGPSGGFTAWLIAEVADRRAPLLSLDTDDGIRHRLWAVTDSAEQDAIAVDLASRQARIADGHHRYAA